MKLKAIASTTTVLALSVAAVPGTANAAAVHPDVSGVCNASLTIGPEYVDGQLAMTVSGEVQQCYDGAWGPNYLVLYMTNAAGVTSFAASGIGQAIYYCQGTTENTFSIGGDIPTGYELSEAWPCG